MAPEVSEKSQANYKPCDVYSLGITFWCIIRRKLPTRVYNVKVKPEFVDDDDDDDDDEIWTKQVGIKNLILRCIEYDPEARPTVEQVVAEIELIEKMPEMELASSKMDTVVEENGKKRTRAESNGQQQHDVSNEILGTPAKKKRWWCC